MKMDVKLNIFTLNCWGIVGISRHRKQRMEAIASHIAESSYDFVFLQEVWCQDDFNMISKKVADVLPYSFYFYSGVLGSGICILSKCCIVDAAMCQFTLNGYAHKILHGDWYGGKGVGLCKVIHHGLKINLYVTHLHAEYNSLHDQYLPHRIAQAFEFSQFVKMTSETADLSIVAGDFNTEPTDLPYQVIIHNADCFDSYLTQKNSMLESPILRTTCGHPDNIYTSQKELNQCPSGKRIDYILYKCGSGTFVECLSCDTPLGKIPGTSIPYSDHEAVVAKLHVFKSVEADSDIILPSSSTAPVPLMDPKKQLEAIDTSHTILCKSIKELHSNRLKYILSCVLLAVFLVLTTLIDDIGLFSIILLFLQLIATLLFGFFFWMTVIVHKIEYSALFSACKSMEILTNALMNEYNIRLNTDFSPSCSDTIL